jgi:hypothetical protein
MWKDVALFAFLALQYTTIETAMVTIMIARKISPNTRPKGKERSVVSVISSNGFNLEEAE